MAETENPDKKQLEENLGKAKIRAFDAICMRDQALQNLDVAKRHVAVAQEALNRAESKEQKE